MSEDEDNGVVVLVADDHEDIRDLVRYRLEGAGYDVITAADGMEALDLARRHHPDIAVLDVMMPGLDGFELTARIRSDSGIGDMPVILLPAKTQDTDVSTGLDAGADDYVRKPFAVAELLARVEARLARGHDNCRS